MLAASPCLLIQTLLRKEAVKAGFVGWPWSGSGISHQSDCPFVPAHRGAAGPWQLGGPPSLQPGMLLLWLWGPGLAMGTWGAPPRHCLQTGREGEEGRLSRLWGSLGLKEEAPR